MSGPANEPSPLTFLGSDRRIVRRLARPLRNFLQVEAAGGILLLLATVGALIWANSPVKDSYHEFWETTVTISIGDAFSLDGHEAAAESEEHGTDDLGTDDHGAEELGTEGVEDTASAEGVEDTASAEGVEDTASAEGVGEAGGSEHHGITLEALVNDALMVIFFFVVGMEIKLELVAGQLRDRRAAALPAMAALGGMVVPALIFFALNPSSPESAGWGIPMATDIAFALGVVSLLGNRVPSSLKVFLLTLAIVDDIGAILVIALFYTANLSLVWLGVAVAMLALVYVMQRVRIWYTPLYVGVGIVVWYAVFESGIHATIAGVALGLLTPAVPLQRKPRRDDWLGPIFGDIQVGAPDVRAAGFEIRETSSVADRLTTILHPFSSYLIIPIFALANAGISLSVDGLADAFTSNLSLGIILGLVVGKLVGITFFTWLATALGISNLPAGVNWPQLFGIATVAGIGFTVSIFITTLAYSDTAIQDEAKLGILIASVIAALVGLVILARSAPAVEQREAAREDAELTPTADF